MKVTKNSIQPWKLGLFLERHKSSPVHLEAKQVVVKLSINFKMNNFHNNLKTLILFIFVYLAFILVQPFIGVIVVSLVFTIIFFPLFEIFHRKWKINSSLSAFVTVLLSSLFFILPLLSLIPLLIREAIIFGKNFDMNGFLKFLQSFSDSTIFGYKLDLQFDPKSIIEAVSSIGPYIASKGLEITSKMSTSLGIFLIFLILYYYFLKDGELLLKIIKNILPYQKKEQSILIDSFKKVASTIFVGNLLGAIASGIIAFIGFWLFGLPSPIIWALFAILLSFIPTAGPLLLYLLGVVIIFFSGSWTLALGLSIYFIVMEMGLRENFIKPKLLDNKLSFHPVFIFFALIGGVTVFGSLGLFYGPVILTLLVSLFRFHNKKEPLKV